MLHNSRLGTGHRTMNSRKKPRIASFFERYMLRVDALLCVAMALVVGNVSAAQDSPQPQEQQPSFRAQSNLVLTPAMGRESGKTSSTYTPG